MVRGAETVYAAQALLLALSGLFLFRWLADHVSRTTAFAAGLLLATSPHALVLVGLVHYSVLHIFLLVAGGWALDRLLRDDAPRDRALLAAGLLWGIATIVRSTTLILPVFVLGLFLLKQRDLRRALRATLLFTAGMAVVIAPVTLRNYRVAHRLVAVNLQAGAAVWGSTVKPLPSDPDAYRWYELSDEFMRIFTRVTGQPQYDYAAYARHHVELDDALWGEALRNLRRDPRPYLINASRTLRTLCLDTSSILIRMFAFSQPPRPWVDAFWFRGTQARGFLPAQPAQAYVRLGTVLTRPRRARGGTRDLPPRRPGSRPRRAVRVPGGGPRPVLHGPPLLLREAPLSGVPRLLRAGGARRPRARTAALADAGGGPCRQPAPVRRLAAAHGTAPVELNGPSAILPSHAGDPGRARSRAAT